MATTSSILIYGHDSTLLETQRCVLEKAGFEVRAASAAQAAMAAVAQEQPDLCVLCHTLAPDERRAVIELAATRQPPVQRLAMCVIHSANDGDGISGPTLDNLAGAEGLISAARELLR